MAPRAQIILPGLFDLPADEFDADFLRAGLPCLNQILRFGAARANDRHTLDDLLGDALFAAHVPGDSLPLAQVCAGERETDGARALLFEAVHLHADLNAALLLPIPRNQRNLNDTDIIIKDLSNLFKVDCDILAVAEGVYLLILREFDAPTHYPHPLSVVGKAANPWTEQSRAHLPWYRLLNEMQMFLHQHACNAERARDGLLTINSLWCWGGGTVDRDSRPSRWFCDDPLLARLPRYLGLELSSTAEFAADLPPVDWNYVDLTLLETLKGARDEVLTDWLRAFDEAVLAPALAWVRRHRASLTLRTASTEDQVIAARDGFRFWRAQRSLADRLQGG